MGVRYASVLPKESLVFGEITKEFVYTIEQKSAFFQDNAAVVDWVNN